MGLKKSDYPFLDELLERNAELERNKPRINCPKYGSSLICAVCRTCLSCYRNAWYGGPVHLWEESLCGECWHKGNEKYRREQAEKRAQQRKTYTYVHTNTTSNVDDDYYPDYEGEDLEDND